MSSTNTTQKIDWQIFVRNLVLYFMQYSQKISHKWLFSGNGNNAGIKTDLTVRGISNIWFASFTIVCISLLFVFWKTEKETRLRAQTNTHTLQSHITGIYRHQYFLLGEHLYMNVFNLLKYPRDKESSLLRPILDKDDKLCRQKRIKVFPSP